jgi:hypothetical protein
MAILRLLEKLCAAVLKGEGVDLAVWPLRSSGRQKLRQVQMLRAPLGAKAAKRAGPECIQEPQVSLSASIGAMHVAVNVGGAAENPR